MSTRRVPALAPIVLAILLTGCGAHPAAAPVARSAQTVMASAFKSAPVIDGPVLACKALAFSNVVARTIDPKALFLGLTGTHIDQTGAPQEGGSWELQYLGSNVAAPAGTPSHSSTTYVRRIDITIGADGKAHGTMSAQAGIPLGVYFVDSPMPTIDSSDAFRLYYAQRAGAEQAPIDQMTLAGTLGSHHFATLVWRIDGKDSAPDAVPMSFDATTGNVLDAVVDAAAAIKGQ